VDDRFTGARLNGPLRSVAVADRLTTMRRAALRLLVLVTIAALCAGCRLPPADALASSTSPESTAPTTETSAPETSGSSFAAATMPAGTEAPAECGFPPGTALEFAGRSTTATLDVQEAVGDPMSDDPADIYITRDMFDQGELHGRLVCAIFVNDPGFVEITVHPEDGGRFVPPTPYPSSTPPAGGVTRAEAVHVALATLDDPDGWKVTVRDPGPIGQVLPFVLDNGYYEWVKDLRPDRWVWVVGMIRGDEGIDVVIDYVDGTPLGTVEYIVN
jgi:hypothetical protein